ncbi:MAG TPA: apolipoprotein N-acyltransferase [Spirochaetes bacterium]|nr:apolipoprotein N-acyltransferase [Spirochaetota bacterium]
MNETDNTSDSPIQPDENNFLKKKSWILLSLFSALLLNLAFPYPGISFLAWIALVPLFLVIMTGNLKRAILSSIITGLAFNIVYIIWMKEYKHPAALSGGVFTEMLFFFFSVILSRFLFKNLKLKRFQFLRVFALAFGWVSIDYLKTIGFLGFPWGILGYSQYDNLALIQSASVFGVWGIDFIIVFSNAAAAAVIIGLLKDKKLKGNTVNIIVAAVLCAVSLITGYNKISEGKKQNFKTVRVALIQANFDPWSPDLRGNIRTEFELTREALEFDPELIVWSESSVPFLYEYYLKRDHEVAREIDNFIVSLGIPFLFGTIEYGDKDAEESFRGNYYNVAVYYNNGKLDDVYRKIHLVPFGEWFPYKKIFPFVATILDKAGAGDFTPGEEYVVFDVGDFKFSVLICFEDAFGDLTRKFKLDGPGFFINVTNDAWTGSRKAEVQHFSISIFRTIENRRSLVRAANGGVTACVDPYGKVLDSIELFTTDFLVCDVPVIESEITTIYSRYGDFLPKIFVILIMIEIFYVITKKMIDRKKKKNKM